MKSLIKGFGRFFILMFASGFLIALFVAGIFLYISMGLPKISSLADYNPPVVSEIYSSDGHLLLEVAKEKRYLVAIDEIPRVIVDALTSAEDDKFFEHSGVDYMGVFRAMIANFKAGRVVQGGSTITQQVAKSLLLTNERSYIRKIKDFLLAQRIEKKFTKEEILYLYLNQMYLGGGYYGIKAATRGYFGKELSELTIAESALIAGLLAAPGRYSPYVKPDFAKSRQKYVLGRMYTTGKITKEQYDQALGEDIRMNIRKPYIMSGGYFTDWVRQRVSEYVGVDKFLTEGFKVVSSIDWELQKTAEDEIKKGLKTIDQRQGFNGPLRTIGVAEDENSEALFQTQLTDLEIKFRKKVYDDESTYFYFTKNGEKRFEYNYEDNEYEKVLEFQKNESEEKNKKYFEVGSMSNDPLLKFIKVGSSYEAVVTNVNNQQRAIYVSIGGVKGVIPYEYFRWAHERSLTEERKYFSYVIKPSTIVKRGDVINVTVIHGSRSPWFYLYKDFRTSIQGKEQDIKDIQRQKFIICMLDQEPEVQGALLAISPVSGKILSLVGGGDFSKSQFNRAIQALRQPGSSFKPFIYSVGLENGYTPATTLIDSPSALGGADDSLNWKPRNYDGQFMGPMTFRHALEVSRNVPTIKLAESVGVDKIVNFVDRIGLNAKLDEDLSLALGSFGVTLKDLVTAYSIFPRGGRKVQVKSIISVSDRFGNKYDVDAIEGILAPTPTVGQSDVAEKTENTDSVAASAVENPGQEKVNPYTQNLSGDQVYDRRLAYIVTNLLRGVIQNGTGRNARAVSEFIGGKTGTTNNYVDAWFMGFSSNVVTGVWTGFDDNRTMGWAETGAMAALPIWSAYMTKALAKFGEYDFSIPEGIVNVMIERDTGKLAHGGGNNTFMEAFVEGTEPGVEEEESAKTSDGEAQEPAGGIMDDDDYYSNQ